MIDNAVVGYAISKLRQKNGMTQQTLAACLNVSHQAVSKWENGAALPDVPTLVQISRMFGVTLEQLISGEVDERDSAPDDDGYTIETDPFGNEKERPDQSASAIGIERIIEMAPFMSRDALDSLLQSYDGTMTAKQIARIAPFVSSETLEKFINANIENINWDTLRRLAPFLKKEMVDKITLATAKGNEFFKPAMDQMRTSSDDISRKLTKGVNKMKHIAKKIGEQLSMAADDDIEEAEEPIYEPEPPKRDARSKIFEYALAQRKWDWLAAHIDELDDDELRHEIAVTAYECGMKDWVRQYIDDDFDLTTPEEAFADGNWDWFSANAEKLSDDQLKEYTLKLYNAGHSEIASVLADERESAELNEILIRRAIENGDDEFVLCVINNANDDFARDFLLKIAREGDLNHAVMCANILYDDTVSELVDIAAENGDWDAMEKLNQYL